MPGELNEVRTRSNGLTCSPRAPPELPPSSPIASFPYLFPFCLSFFSSFFFSFPFLFLSCPFCPFPSSFPCSYLVLPFLSFSSRSFSFACLPFPSFPFISFLFFPSLSFLSFSFLPFFFPSFVFAFFLPYCLLFLYPPTPAGCWGSAPEKNAPETEADRQAGRQADRQTDRRETERQRGRQTEREPESQHFLGLGSLALAAGICIFIDFFIGSEGNLRQWSLLARCRFRPSVPWCFAASEPPAGRSLWSCFEGMGAALWSWFLVGSEGNVRQWTLLARRRFRPSMPWCFAVSEPPAGRSLWSCFEGMGAALWSWFLVGSEGNVRQWTLLARCRFRPSVPWCFAVSEPLAGRSLWNYFLRACELHFGAGFLSVQKATLGSGACLLGAASVLQCHGVLLLRNRPLGGRCGAVLRAWELHFGAGFLSAQKATLGSGPCLLGAASVLQCHGVLLFRNRPLGGRCGAVLRAWELHFGAGFLSAQKATLGSGPCLLGAASVRQCHGVCCFGTARWEVAVELFFEGM